VAFDAPKSCEAKIDRAMLWVHIGEKNYLSCPVKTLLCRPAPDGRVRRFIPLLAPLYIPSVLNFTVSLIWKQESPTTDVTCVLGGYLSREIC
jgi:hypothetical protein